jgi:CRISPR-associated protein Csd2
MSPRALLVFKHDSALGRAPSHTLFEKLQITSYSTSPSEDGKPAREFTDYASRITFDGQPLDEVVKTGASRDLGNGITLIRRI